MAIYRELYTIAFLYNVNTYMHIFKCTHRTFSVRAQGHCFVHVWAQHGLRRRWRRRRRKAMWKRGWRRKKRGIVFILPNFTYALFSFLFIGVVILTKGGAFRGGKTIIFGLYWLTASHYTGMISDLRIYVNTHIYMYGLCTNKHCSIERTTILYEQPFT